MKKMVIDCTNGTQDYVELTAEEIAEVKARQLLNVREPEVETLEEKITRIVKEELKK